MTSEQNPAGGVAVRVEATVGPLYDDRDAEKLEPHYTRHLNAMTAERLNKKFEIAAELAHRDAEIERLRSALSVIDSLCNEASAIVDAGLRPNGGFSREPRSGESAGNQS